MHVEDRNRLGALVMKQASKEGRSSSSLKSMLLAEILVTFILVFVIISVATYERAPAGVAPLAVGFALACGAASRGRWCCR